MIAPAPAAAPAAAPAPFSSGAARQRRVGVVVVFHRYSLSSNCICRSGRVAEVVDVAVRPRRHAIGVAGVEGRLVEGGLVGRSR